ncbi:hypothetical protein ACTXT7_004333 [Hymenolepis weldensis]
MKVLTSARLIYSIECAENIRFGVLTITDQSLAFRNPRLTGDDTSHNSVKSTSISTARGCQGDDKYLFLYLSDGHEDGREFKKLMELFTES